MDEGKGGVSLLLADLIVLPMQRLCKYELLLKALLAPGICDAATQAPLQQAWVVARTILNKVNEETKRIEYDYCKQYGAD